VRPLWLAAATLVLLLSAAAGSAVCAQDTTAAAPAPAPDTVQVNPSAIKMVGDSVRRPLSPMGAFWRSLLVPGWGQARLNRRLTAGVFVTFEGITLGMALKASHELGYLRSINDGRATGKKNERQDWLILLGFNHLMAALEAYVSAHLWDFPKDLHVRAMPGGLGAQVPLPVRIR
jgi:hypothetical protein